MNTTELIKQNMKTESTIKNTQGKKPLTNLYTNNINFELNKNKYKAIIINDTKKKTEDCFV